MAKPTTRDLLAIYRKALAKYEEEGSDMAAVERRMIARLEAELASEIAA